MHAYRIERDTLGEVQVPAEALYGAQTQRAIDNFPLSGMRLPAPFIHALGLIKQAAAQVNAELGLLEAARAQAIGYDHAAQIAKQAAAEGRRVKDVAAAQTDLSAAELDRLLDPRRMLAGGIAGG